MYRSKRDKHVRRYLLINDNGAQRIIAVAPLSKAALLYARLRRHGIDCEQITVKTVERLLGGKRAETWTVVKIGKDIFVKCWLITKFIPMLKRKVATNEKNET
jgi:hypothetical protein